MAQKIIIPAVDRPVASIDDDPQFQILLRMMYRRSSIANEMLTFSTGVEFLDYMDRVATKKIAIPSILLVDINMPVIDGFEVVNRIRKNRSLAVQPLIAMLSCSCSAEDKRRGFAVGADQYIEKPMRIFDLSFLGGMPGGEIKMGT